MSVSLLNNQLGVAVRVESLKNASTLFFNFIEVSATVSWDGHGARRSLHRTRDGRPSLLCCARACVAWLCLQHLEDCRVASIGVTSLTVEQFVLRFVVISPLYAMFQGASFDELVSPGPRFTDWVSDVNSVPFSRMVGTCGVVVVEAGGLGCVLLCCAVLLGCRCSTAFGAGTGRHSSASAYQRRARSRSGEPTKPAARRTRASAVSWVPPLPSLRPQTRP